ncbi:cleavage stimulating factor 64 isoform X2 [Morus notabilis]|uniref:cleavage stimulating factor 64 isoform X2 n=1 Tax=Morus notabilis TaxID=981085 RepID=UPI000CED0D82|nr:cleavage stimulating factor 64 isoform X2 [Morus notabilis]
MASSSQHRCVFVGNIPYDATEEQLIEICQEVGPVVSFRLVIDRETGKPKGYGFCEYKDEETALSARRNLQGYEINGRQLRVDFAENDKGADRNREQGRGGPGFAPSVDPSKQVGAPAVHGESAQHQPIGLHIAITGAAVMAGALGGPQAGVQGQLALANDPLTLHLAKMSRSQLNEIISELKGMATRNKELARQLLLARPQLPKALFQAQIMLGMVTPQVLQTPNLRQGSVQDSQTGQVPAMQPLSMRPPLAQSSMQSGLFPKVEEGHVSIVPQNSLARNQFSSPIQLPMPPRVQLPQPVSEHALQQASLPGHSLVSSFTPLHPHSSSSLSIRPQIQVAKSSINQQLQPPQLKNLIQVGAANLGHSTQMVHPNATIQPSTLSHHSSLDAGYKPGPSISSGTSRPISRDADRSVQVSGDSTWAHRSNINSNFSMRLAEKTSFIPDPMASVDRPSKMIKLDNRTLPVASLNLYNANGSTPPQPPEAASLPASTVPKSEARESGKQISQLPSEVESALLQQVLNLTPEQLSSLPPEQQQQVIQLQQMLKGATP